MYPPPKFATNLADPPKLDTAKQVVSNHFELLEFMAYVCYLRRNGVPSLEVFL